MRWRRRCSEIMTRNSYSRQASTHDLDEFFLRRGSTRRSFAPTSSDSGSDSENEEKGGRFPLGGAAASHGRNLQRESSDPAGSRRVILQQMQGNARLKALDSLCSVAFSEDASGLCERLESEQNRIMSALHQDIQQFVMTELSHLKAEKVVKRGELLEEAHRAAAYEVESAADAARRQSTGVLARRELKIREDMVRSQVALEQARKREATLLQLNNSLERGFSHSIIALREDLGSLADEKVMTARKQAEKADQEALNAIREEYLSKAKQECSELEYTAQTETQALLRELRKEFELSRAAAAEAEASRLADENAKRLRDLTAELEEQAAEEAAQKVKEARTRHLTVVHMAEDRRLGAVAHLSEELRKRSEITEYVGRDGLQNVRMRSLEEYAAALQACDAEAIRLRTSSGHVTGEDYPVREGSSAEKMCLERLPSFLQAFRLQNELEEAIEAALDMQGNFAQRLITAKKRAQLAHTSQTPRKERGGICRTCRDIFAENEQLLRALGD
jgi:hypothetical protein